MLESNDLRIQNQNPLFVQLKKICLTPVFLFCQLAPLRIGPANFVDKMQLTNPSAIFYCVVRNADKELIMSIYR